MVEFSQELDSLRFFILKLKRTEQDRDDVNNSNLSAAMKDEQVRAIESQIKLIRKNMKEVLQTLLEFPPHHIRHQHKLQEFYTAAGFENAGFEKSVFVMTKFDDPASNAAIDVQLRAVVAAVRKAVDDCGFKARLASDKDYHPQLWDNVELHLLGCKRGIAIVEDKYRPELNPNVAMEWGWLRGMGRNVLYLVEKDFNQARADWDGLIEKPFDWANPVPGITAGIQAWLTGP
jgi:hypothetical protein